MGSMTTDFLAEVARYYSDKLAEHGETPQGVDWNGENSQFLRFEQLSKIIDRANSFSVNDLGCGYGAFYDFLSQHYENFVYNGYDVSDDMISAALNRFANNSNAIFTVATAPTEMADYGIASGIFNVRLDRSDAEWQDYLHQALDTLYSTSRRGFAFNCLTSYSDADKMRDYLYYADPCVLFHFCKKRYSRHVALLHDYGLFEFTILVKRNP